MTEEVLLARTEHGVWAWVAVRIEAAVALDDLAEHAELTRADRYAGARTAERGWLAECADEQDCRIELRYLGEDGQLSCVLLGRVHGSDTSTVVRAAVRLREALARTPRHVRTTALSDPAEISRWLCPFTPHREGLTEIRRRIRIARPTRPDAGVRYYLAVPPFTQDSFAWEAAWRALIEQPHPVLLTIGLHPFRIPTSVGSALRTLAAQYQRLASPGRSAGVWSAGEVLAPDPFAVSAARLFTEVAQRYTTAARAYRLRVALAAPEPLRAEPVHRTAAAISDPSEDQQHIAVRPSPDEFDTAERNLTSLEQHRWDAEYLRELPDRPPESVRLLAELASPAEASGVFRLPLAPDGTVPGFPVLAEVSPAARNAARAEHIGNLIQAGQIHGDVHIHGGAGFPRERETPDDTDDPGTAQRPE